MTITFILNVLLQFDFSPSSKKHFFCLCSVKHIHCYLMFNATTYVTTYTYLQSANISFVGMHAKLQHTRMEDYACLKPYNTGA
jgi:hypothetical protein